MPRNMTNAECYKKHFKLLHMERKEFKKAIKLLTDEEIAEALKGLKFKERKDTLKFLVMVAVMLLGIVLFSGMFAMLVIVVIELLMFTGLL